MSWNDRAGTRNTSLEVSVRPSVGQVARTGGLLLSLAVADLDAYLTALRQQGVDAGPVRLPDGVRGARLRDPDGNEIELVEADGRSHDRTPGWLEVVSAPPPQGGN